MVRVDSLDRSGHAIGEGPQGIRTCALGKRIAARVGVVLQLVTDLPERDLGIVRVVPGDRGRVRLERQRVPVAVRLLVPGLEEAEVLVRRRRLAALPLIDENGDHLEAVGRGRFQYTVECRPGGLDPCPLGIHVVITLEKPRADYRRAALLRVSKNRVQCRVIDRPAAEIRAAGHRGQLVIVEPDEPPGMTMQGEPGAG